MVIEKIEIVSFGKFKDYTLDLEDGINVLFGENEAGKSTICTFIYAMFYDLPTSKQKYTLREDLRKRYTPWSGEQMEGSVWFSHKDKKYVLKRKIGKTPKGSKVQLLDAETWEEITDERKEEPGRFFFGVGEDGFLKTLYISQLGAQISKEKDDEIIKRLSNLRQSGDEDISYQKTLDKLTKQKHALISVGGGAGKIVTLKKENEELLKELEKVTLSEETYKNATQKEQDAKKKKEELVKKSKEIETAKALSVKYENYEKMQAAKEELKETLEQTDKVNEAYNLSNEEIADLRKKEETYRYLENADENTINRLLDLEKEEAVFVKQIEDLKKKTQKAEEIKLEIESLNLKKGKINILLLSGAVLVFVLSIALMIAVSPLLALGIAAALVLLILSILPKFKDKETKEEIDKLSLELSAIRLLENEEKDILKKKEENKKIKDEILKLTKCENSADLLNKTAENKNLKEVIKAKESENTILFETLKKAKVKIDDLREKSTISYYPEGVINIKGPNDEEIKKSFDEIQNEILICEKALTEAQTTMSALDKEERSTAEIKNLIESNEEEIKELLKVYEATEKAILMIEESYNILRSDFAPVLSEKVKDAASFLTDGKYTDVRVSDDYSLKVQSGSDIIDADYLSGGTYDILYLALRLGISKVISKDEDNVLILDDAFLQLDDKRTKNAAEYLKKTPSKQVLYFTCHENQTGIFGEENVNIIRF
ncbi:MAG: AAA family ATPase [Clostridia bacterium]|nr:AAA family ATPase [Clostridia bacterium]